MRGRRESLSSLLFLGVFGGKKKEVWDDAGLCDRNLAARN
jgi:hypothetical protein